VAVFAHPGSRSKGGVREAAVRDAASAGLDGIEVDHPDHTDDAVRQCVELANELDLVQTSGSDDHGTGIEGPRLGCRTVSHRVVQQLEARAAAHRR
jgi:predicted metal-dependent phosphoesterase TrpH